MTHRQPTPGVHEDFSAKVSSSALGSLAPCPMCQRSQAALQKAADLAEAKVEELIERWNSDLGATVETRAAGAAAYIIAGLQGDIIALQIQCDRAATPAPQSHLMGAVREVLEVAELREIACKGSDAPAEHALGLLAEAYDALMVKSDDCPRCGGLGYHTRNELAEHPDDVGRMYRCTRCHGGGKAAPPVSRERVSDTPPRCRCEYPMIKYGGKTVACDHCGLPPGHSPVRQPQTHVDGERKFCDFPECGCSSGAAERCSHPPVSNVKGSAGE